MSSAPYRRRFLRGAAGLFVAGCLAWWHRAGDATAATVPRVKPAPSPPARQAPPVPEVIKVNACVPDELLRQLWPDPSVVRFQPTSLQERRAFTRLVPGLVRAAREQTVPPQELVALATGAGFTLEPITLGEETLWVLREARGRQRGAGAYLVRTGEANQDFVQAPHHFFDLGTGPLGLSLFACAPRGQRPRLFATNTAHRFKGVEGERRADADHPADLAHNPDHLFQLVTDLAARELPRLRVFQVHGFGKEREARAAAAAIVSGGSRAPSECARKVAGRLLPVLGNGVRLYPDQIKQLGGTRNAQARLLQAYPGARFVHLELSPTTREALTSPEQLQRVAAALFHPEED